MRPLRTPRKSVAENVLVLFLWWSHLLRSISLFLQHTLWNISYTSKGKLRTYRYSFCDWFYVFCVTEEVRFSVLMTFLHTLQRFLPHLNVQSCKLHNNKYIIASTQITNTEIFIFKAVLVFKLLNRKSFVYKKRRQ